MKKLLLLILLLTGCQTETSIGAVLPLTGVEERQGEVMKNALLLAEEDLGITITIEDSKSTAKDAVSAYDLLTQTNKVVGVITITSPVAITLSEKSNVQELPLLAFATAPIYSTPDDYTYRISPSALEEGEFMAEVVYEESSEIGVIYVNNPYGVGTKDAFKNSYEALGGKVVVEEAFAADETDFRTLILKLQDVETVYVASWGKPAGMFAAQAEEQGAEFDLFYSQASYNPDFIDEGGEAVEGALIPFTTINKDSSFYERYMERFGEAPTPISERTYDAAMILGKLSEVCEDTVCVKEALDNQIFRGTSHSISFDENGDVVDELVLYEVVDGEFTAR